MNKQHWRAHDDAHRQKIINHPTSAQLSARLAYLLSIEEYFIQQTRLYEDLLKLE